MKTNRGFTLLEVLVALVLFATTFIVLVEIESNHINRFYNNLKKIKALTFFKEKKLNLKTKSEDFKIESRRYRFDNFFIEENSVLNREGKEILLIKRYIFVGEKR